MAFCRMECARFKGGARFEQTGRVWVCTSKTLTATMNTASTTSRSLLIPVAIGAIAVSALQARAQMQLLDQHRNISIATTADGVLLSAQAPDFAPFIQALENNTLFISPAGPRPNRARTTITSILDSNALQLAGTCEGEGGEDENGQPVLGENHVDIDVDFELFAESTPIHLSALPRPTNAAVTDSFRVLLRNRTTSTDVFEVSTNDPPTLVNVFRTLPAGTYNFRFHADFTVSTETRSFAFGAQLLLPPFGCDSIDFNNDGSVFDPQDIDAFLSRYSEGPCIPDTAICNDIDFNNDQTVFDPQDIEAFLRVYAEGPCL